MSELKRETSRGTIFLPYTLENTLNLTESERLYQVKGHLSDFMFRGSAIYGHAGIFKREIRESQGFFRIPDIFKNSQYSFSTKTMTEDRRVQIYPEPLYRNVLRLSALSDDCIFDQMFLDLVFSPLDKKIDEFMNV